MKIKLALLFGAVISATSSMAFAQADLGSFGLTKWEGFTQTSTAAPSPNATDGFQMYINILNGSSGTILPSTTVTPPAGATGSINLVENGGNNGLFFEEFFATKAAMDAAFPDGTYSYTINTSTPNTYNRQQNTGSDAYPPVPMLTTSGATWSNGTLLVNTTADYTFTYPGYNSPGGNSTSLTITNSSGNVVSYTHPGDGTPGSFTLTANTLQEGQNYNCYIQYGNGAFQTQVNFSINSNVGTHEVILQKSAEYDQSSTATPTPDPEEPFQLYVNFNPAITGSLYLTSTATPPSASSGKIALGLGSDGLVYIQDFASSSLLDSAFGNGTYNVAIQTSAPSTISGQMSFGAEDYPIIPQITNTTWSGNNLQVDPTQDFTLTWNSFNVSDHGTVFLQINNTSIGQAFNADGTQTSFVIPANTLQPNKLYQATLNFLSLVNSTSTFSGQSGASFQSTVKFLIQTGTVSSGRVVNEVGKENLLLQASNSNPVNASAGSVGYQDGAPYQFTAQCAASGSVTGPSSPIALSFSADSSGAEYRFESAPLASQSAMDSKYPNGTYTLTDGNTVNLTGNLYPTAPKVIAVNGALPIWNSHGMLELDPNIANTLTWTPYSGSNFSTSGSEHFELQSEAGDDVDISQKAGVSTSTSASFTTITIPANTLTMGHTYVGDINYLQASTFTSPMANVYDAAGYATVTYFNVIATPTTGTAQTISFPNIGTIGFSSAPITLNATATSGLPVSYSVSGPATVSGNMLTLTGTGAVMVTASQGGNSSYAPAADVSQTITVKQGTQTISFPSVGAQSFGGPAVTLSATASSGLPVAFTLISGPATLSSNMLTFTGAGSVVVHASQSGNSDFAAAPTVSQTIVVGKEAQTITFPTISDQTFPAAPVALGATATSGLAVTYAVSGPAKITGSTLSFTGAGTVTVKASQVGDTTFAPAPTVSQTITVSKGTQTINFANPGTQTFGVAPLTLSATATSGLPVVFKVTSGPATVSGTKLTITGGGSVTVQASQAGDASVAAAPDVSQTFTVNPAAQTITFPTIPAKTFGVAPFTLVATSSSKLPVSFSVVSGPASVSGTKLTITGGGAVEIEASQAGNASYSAASNVTQTFTVNPKAQTISFATVPAKTFASAPFDLIATATSGLPVSFTYVSGPATLSGNQVTITGVGTVVVEATQAGNANYLAATSVSKSIVVAKAPQTINVGTVTGVVFGDSPITLSPTASSTLAVTLTYISGPGSLTGDVLTITGAGTIVLHASQAGNAGYLTAPTVTQSIVVAKAAQTITFPAVGNQTFPSAPITLGATSSSGLTVTYSVTGPASVSGNTLTLKGTGTVKIKALQVGNANYLAALPITQTITVSP